MNIFRKKFEKKWNFFSTIHDDTVLVKNCGRIPFLLFG